MKGHLFPRKKIELAVFYTTQIRTTNQMLLFRKRSLFYWSKVRNCDHAIIFCGCILANRVIRIDLATPEWKSFICLVQNLPFADFVLAKQFSVQQRFQIFFIKVFRPHFEWVWANMNDHLFPSRGFFYKKRKIQTKDQMFLFREKPVFYWSEVFIFFLLNTICTSVHLNKLFFLHLRVSKKGWYMKCIGLQHCGHKIIWGWLAALAGI